MTGTSFPASASSLSVIRSVTRSFAFPSSTDTLTPPGASAFPLAWSAFDLFRFPTASKIQS